MRQASKKLGKTVTLMVFARAPVMGRCKTRLIPAYGARGAAAMHRDLSERTLALATASGIASELWCEPDSGHGFFHACRRRNGVALRRQPAGDLGHKMGYALNAALRSGAHKALVIGTDCAALMVTDLRAAIAALDQHDCVLQPATDGGYVLIGARRPVHAALRGIRWSSGLELAQTRQRLALRGLSCALLPPLWDVDHAPDVRRARAEGLL